MLDPDVFISLLFN